MLSLHDTLSGQAKPVVPADGKRLTMYVCGITPYDYCHLGHARTLVSFDILRRWMEHQGIEVLHIQNVTDIDDKIIKRAGERKMRPLELSAKFDALSREEMKRLGVLTPTVMPKISEHIPQTVALIEKIISNGFAYVTASGVYFDISKMPDYGKLSGQNLEKIRAGARIEIDEKKKNPEDFALWKLEETEGATYDSPWGRGRPGWHIECSAMSLHYTKGQPLDLHGGARDLIFPHHENEIAQSQAAGVKPFARHWAHTGFLTVKGEKMAKSLGNFITIEEGLKKWDAQTLRLFYALTHYRSPIDLSEEALAGAKTTLENVRKSLSVMEGEGVGAPDSAAEARLGQEVDRAMRSFSDYMDSDLDTPQALSALITGAKQVARAREEGKCSRKVLEMASGQIAGGFAVLGLEVGIQKHAHAHPPSATAAKLSKEQIDRLIAQRQEARVRKDFKTADAIRKQLADAGVILEDSKDGSPKWRYA